MADPYIRGSDKSIKEGMPSIRFHGKRLLWGMFGSSILCIFVFARMTIWNWKLILDSKYAEHHPEVFTKLSTDDEDVVFQKLIGGFIELMPNVTYLMMYGTLLGSYRHHGMIPWDADADLVIRSSEKEVAHSIFMSLKPDSEYKFIPHSDLIWRFFHNESQETGDPWKWPYLDIYFYLENSTHIWNSDVPGIKFEKSLIFPLIKRPYMGYLLPAPKCPKEILEKSYDLDVCVWTRYIVLKKHQELKDGLRSERLACEALYDIFPFVTRRENGTGIMETLEIGNVRVPGSPEFFSEHSVHDCNDKSPHTEEAKTEHVG